MKKLVGVRYVFICCVFPATLSSVSTMSAYAADNQTGWTLLQLSRLSGKQRVKLDNNHVKMESLKSGLVSLLVGPPWKVYCYSSRKKIIFASDLAHFRDALETGFTGDAELDLIQETPLEKAKGTQLNIAGLRSQHFFMRNTKALLARHAQPKTSAEEFSALPSVEPVPMASIDYWVARDIVVPLQVSKFICEIYKLPLTTLIPLRLKAQDAIARTTTELDTFGCVSGRIPPSEFAIPRGFRKVKSFQEIVFDEGTQSQAVEMMQGLMNDEDDSSNSNQPKKPSK